jgi:hypothetical protein
VDAAPTSRRGATDIWADDEAVSVDPESVRPPPPVHAIAEARATQGPLGVKKKAPKPPSPKLKSRSLPAPEPDDVGNSIPVPMPDFEDDAKTAPIAPAAPIAQLSLPLVTEFAETPTPLLIDTTPTVPRDVKAPPVSKPAPASPVSSEPPEKRRSLFPLVLLGAAAGVCLMFALKRQAPSEPVPAAPEPARTAAPAEPTNAQVAPTPPAEPEPTAAVSAEAPASPPPATAAAPAAKPDEATASAKPSTATTHVVTPATPSPAAATPATPKEPKPEATAAKPEGKKPTPPEQPQVDDVGGEFDKAAAGAALGAAASSAAGCRKEGDPTGVAVVHVTFSNAGRATRALVEGPPFAGTATGGCIADTLRRAKVPPFGGDRVTVTKRVVIQ